jgi:hypothetical protein
MMNPGEAQEQLDDAAASTVAIELLLQEHPDPARALIMTALLAGWLQGFDAGEQPAMLAMMSQQALSLLGYNVEARIEKTGKHGGMTKRVKRAKQVDTNLKPGAVSHLFPADDEVTAAVELVIEKARELKLHGVIILSPVCKGCGCLHDFAMVSDMDYGADGELVRLLTDFADHAATPGAGQRPIHRHTGTQ